MTKSFDNAFGSVNVNTNTNEGNTSSYESNVDWNAYNNKVLEVMGGEGKRVLIGYVSQVVDLGEQVLDEQVNVWDAEAKKNHGWRLEPRKDKKTGEPIGEGQADPTAKLEQRKRKGKMVECLVFQQPPVRQAAICVDFPEAENIFPYNEFFEGSEPAPFRAIIGEHGFITDKRKQLAGTMNIVGKPFNLKHINVNRQKEGSEAHFALAKNGMLYNLADYTGSTDADGNFHAGDLGKLIGKPLTFEVEVVKDTWMKDGEEQVKVKVIVTPQGALSKRDQTAWDSEIKDAMKDEYLGFVLFDGGNDEVTLKKLNSKILNTIKMSPSFTGSKLEEELTKVGKLGGNSTGSSSQQSAAGKEASSTSGDVSKESGTVEKPVEDDPMKLDDDFDDTIPF